MKKTFFLLALIAVSVGLTGCSLLGNQTANQNTNVVATTPENTNQPVVVPVAGYEDWQTFTNTAGGYTFKYPANWKAEINQYNAKNALFGPDATTSVGLGGVETSSFSGTLDDYLGYMQDNAEVKYLSRDNGSVNGIAVIRTKYQGFPVSGLSVVLKKDGEVLSIYINSQETNNVVLFDKLVNSFTLIN